ncbi:hypothetical protein ABTH88_20215, partial [Acinetobacter baumannii]
MNPLRHAAALALASGLTACGAGQPDNRAEPSTLVTVVRPLQGSLPMLVEAYGTAAASGNGQQTISISQPG